MVCFFILYLGRWSSETFYQSEVGLKFQKVENPWSKQCCKINKRTTQNLSVTFKSFFPALISKHCRFISVFIPQPVQSFASSFAAVLIGLQVSLVVSLSVSKKRSIFLMRFCLLTLFFRRSNRLSALQATDKLYQTCTEGKLLLFWRGPV